MSEICPHCGKGFKRLASHEWRCKEKGTAASPSSTLQPRSSSSSSSPSGAGRSTTPSAGNRTSARRPTSADVGNSSKTGAPQGARRRSSNKPAEVVVNICPDCGANYRYKHDVCHSRGSGKREDKAAYDVMEVCPDCGQTYKYKHTVCRGSQKINPVRHHRLVIPNRPPNPTNQQSTRHEYTTWHEQGRGTYNYKGDLAESEGLARANVQGQRHARRHRHERTHDNYNGVLNEEERLAAAFEASLNLKEENP
ncbi:uncharacterized protein LOC124133247 isoform X2 [Haliotis rufescens]|uniref:uncharacterized protein LOC124133247 isoform X2 n=1 Tax=Haliotis rufescens TaxID=6454 RepID=UPI00201EF8D9|nr:uncharacterized protein LOC124133247 isoform X2 [Haliotis rufescens]